MKKKIMLMISLVVLFLSVGANAQAWAVKVPRNYTGTKLFWCGPMKTYKKAIWHKGKKVRHYRAVGFHKYKHGKMVSTYFRTSFYK